MLGSLTPEQCKYILHSNHVGRIGCHAQGKVMVIPITYVSDGEHIYGYSLEGKKIQMMRTNPEVCFEVDCIENLANWRSVIAWGKFEELKSPYSQAKARKLFLERLLPLTAGETVDPSREFACPPHIVEKKLKPVVYRITLNEITGRFEKQVTS
jgi:uncharacterized protein